MEPFNISCRNKKEFKFALRELDILGFKWKIDNYLEVFFHYNKKYNNYPLCICYDERLNREYLMYDYRYKDKSNDYSNAASIEVFFKKQIRREKLKKINLLQK